ncbi:MAG: hypothetical protein NT031_14805, partial [Planctomycetota bacterium]|nr:hypothetical protein [Planctomycetota bacterium]
ALRRRGWRPDGPNAAFGVPLPGGYNAVMTFQEIPLAAKLAGLWLLVNVFPAMRVADHARRLGRAPWLWFSVSLLFTPIPFLWVAARFPAPRAAAGGRRAAGMTRCPHCRKFFDRRELAGAGGRCPLCGMPLPKENHA